MLINDPKILLDYNGFLKVEDYFFTVGSDGGEFTYHIKLNGGESV